VLTRVSLLLQCLRGSFDLKTRERERERERDRERKRDPERSRERLRARERERERERASERKRNTEREGGSAEERMVQTHVASSGRVRCIDSKTKTAPLRVNTRIFCENKTCMRGGE